MQPGLEHSQQLVFQDRLNQAVAKSCLEDLPSLLRKCVSGNGNHWCLAVRRTTVSANGPNYVEARYTGHAEVQKNQIERTCSNVLDSLDAIRGFAHLRT